MMSKSLPVLLVLTRAFPYFIASVSSSSSTMTPPVSRDIYVPPDVMKMTSDARSWYLTGVVNAEKDLPKFESIASQISQGSETYKPQLKQQLSSLLSQAQDANENTKVLFPRLTGLIASLDQWTQDPISFWSKLKLKATLWYINGKRDNKSYYLQNGAALWAKLRVERYLQPIYGTSTEAVKVGNMLNGLKEDLLLARDELDDAAQIYVKGIQKLVSLVSDVGRNGQQIRTVVKELKANGDERGGSIVSSAQTSVDNIQKQINEL